MDNTTKLDDYQSFQEKTKETQKARNRRLKAEIERQWMDDALGLERSKRGMNQGITIGVEEKTFGLGATDRKADTDMVTRRDVEAQSIRKPSSKEDLKLQLKDIAIVREGNRLLIPEDMPLEDAIARIQMKIKEGEKKIELEYDFQLMVPEGALALFNTLNDLYGFYQLMDRPTFFGPEPPTMLTVEVSKEHTQMIPWGRFGVPGIPGFIETEIKWTNKVPYFKLKATIPAGFKMEIQNIVDHMKARTDSIYKGSAIKVKFPPQERGTPVSDFFPRFMDLANITEDRLIFSRDVADIVDMALFTPIRKTEHCRRRGIPLKRGILLEGPPGVGKTLTASVTATMAQQNGWTFIQTDDVNDLPRVYKFAMHHQPAVIFCEDLDVVLKAANERDDVINSILNSIDGIESKNTEILLVLTTNFVGKITKESLRPGRIDAVVPVRPPDADAARRLIVLYAGATMRPTEDLTVAGELLAGKMAAVVREVVERSKLSAIRRLESLDDELVITARDIEVAAHGMAAHNALLEPDEQDDRSDFERAAEIIAAAMLTRAGAAPNGKLQGVLTSPPHRMEELPKHGPPLPPQG
jgi:hypothetical protein